MILKSFSYSELNDRKSLWKVPRFSLNRINLLVGKNATGKTRLINSLNALATLIRRPPNPLFSHGSWYARFKDSKDEYELSIEIRDNAVFSEKLYVTGVLVLERHSDGTGFVQSSKLNVPLQFEIDDKLLALNVKRDSIQHPFLDRLYTWSEGVRTYLFGSDFGKSLMVGLPYAGSEQEFLDLVANIDTTDINNIVGLYSKCYSQFGDKFDKLIIKDMGAIGYDLEYVGTIAAAVALPGIPLFPGHGVPTMLEVQEVGVSCRVRQHELSAGMYRALAIVIHINHAVLSKSNLLMVVDDVGEGLDFERSSSLIDLLITKAKRAQIQIIMSTNDRFVMNNVPLEYWQFLERNGSTISVRNRYNNRTALAAFEYTGLNNFDYFRTSSAK